MVGTPTGEYRPAPMERTVLGALQRFDIQSSFVASLRRYFRKRVPVQEVDDHVQDVLLSLQRRQHDDEIEDIERYVFVIAGNLLRRRARQRLNQQDVLRQQWETKSDITPERIVMSRERLKRTREAIANLPPRTRDVFVLHRFEDMTYQSIADGLGISVSAVEKRIIVALKHLKAAEEGER